ncbi:MAG: radical SAM protein, partial [Treponemataceae bacterium]|nr:radical SAM protein [Treponemataceae bacterium]
MNVVIITPPVVQLNTPYPSGAYLQNYFKRPELAEYVDYVQWDDLSIDLFHAVFSSTGLKTIFDQTAEKALRLADEAEAAGDDGTAFNLRRYVSSAPLWIQWIDTIKAMLGCSSNGCHIQVSGREFVHEFVRSAHAPRGQRMDQFLQNLGRDICADDAQMLCTFALADLSDYITAVYDENFALIRYAEHLAASNAPFSVLEAASRGPVLAGFYEPIVRRYLKQLRANTTPGEKTLFCISVPFAGTFAAALATCRVIRSTVGAQAVISMGGGYVNTALRSVHEPAVFTYTDYLSYDRGYGFYRELLSGRVTADAATTGETAAGHVGGALLPGGLWYELSEDARKFEELCTRSVTPDYCCIDFSRYPRLADDVNPMHRIWSDGAWLKAYLAHGCYWHRCSFCDTTLDYVCNYKPVDTLALHGALLEQAEKTGVYGIHFVDEAAPPVALEKFALQNCKSSAPCHPRLTFWGNIRFEKAFTRDMADILAYGGLTGVSAGLEVASNDGLDNVHKGIDIQSVVSACAAFKEAGILVHSYMIYGFYDETPQQLVNSLDTLRQLFKAGLIDSAFYHKFSLTEHSTIYKEWKDGKHPKLHPIPADTTAFSTYERSFSEEARSEKYGNGVQTALSNWMHGHGLDKNVTKWFDFPMPQPTVSKHLVDDEIARYEERNRKAYAAKQGDERYVWLGGT